jgi:hypothetical protein
MKGLQQMNQGLAEAVIATFREADQGIHGKQLAPFRGGDWRRSLHWLDASGLALYFWSRINSLGLKDCVPPEITEALELRLQHNRNRTAQLFKEFECINRAFQAAGLQYANLKGFTLVPDYCPDPALRCQFDLDFIMSSSEALVCREILNNFGYAQTGKCDDVVEFKAGMEQACSIGDLYKPRSQRAVEVHLIPQTQPATSTSGPPARIQTQVWNGVVFPAFSDTDKFLWQARHLFRHVKSEWTRISWLLEFRTFVTAHRDESEFWQQVRQKAANSDEDPLAVGIAVWLATTAFGEFAPPALTEWSSDVLPEPMRLWLECYGTRVLLADFPGTKLYLLLERELSKGSDFRKVHWGKVLPLHRPPRVTYPSGGSVPWSIRASFSEMRFTLFRTRFHIAEGTRYLIEVQRWKRIMNGMPGWGIRPDLH